MGSQSILFITLILGLIAAADIARRSLMMIAAEQKIRQEEIMMRKLRKPKQPWITVLIYKKNKEQADEKTLRSVRRSHYVQYDVVIVGDQSQDLGLIKKYVQKLKSKQPIAFLQRRVVGSTADAYRAGYRKSKRGSMVLCLTAGEVLEPSTLKRMVLQKTNASTWRISAIKEKEFSNGIVGLVHRLKAVIWRPAIKLHAYTPWALRHLNRYPTFKWRGFLLFVSVAVSALLLSLGILFAGALALWYGWLLCSVYLLALIWLYADATTGEKWRQTFALPSAFFLLPIASFVEVVFQLSARKK